MKYYGLKDKFWGIDYLVDINEIILHYGKKIVKGKLLIFIKDMKAMKVMKRWIKE